jgi:hypothetical protein
MKTALQFKSKTRYGLAKEVLLALWCYDQSMIDNEFPSDYLSVDDENLTLTISGEKWQIDSAISELADYQIWPVKSFIGPAQFTIQKL